MRVRSSIGAPTPVIVVLPVYTRRTVVAPDEYQF
jgi:hypothetical protein